MANPPQFSEILHAASQKILDIISQNKDCKTFFIVKRNLISDSKILNYFDAEKIETQEVRKCYNFLTGKMEKVDYVMMELNSENVKNN